MERSRRISRRRDVAGDIRPPWYFEKSRLTLWLTLYVESSLLLNGVVSVQRGLAMEDALRVSPT